MQGNLKQIPRYLNNQKNFNSFKDFFKINILFNKLFNLLNNFVSI